MTQKRYQYIGPNGPAWTKYFRVPDSTLQEPVQLKGTTRSAQLKNEYITT